MTSRNVEDVYPLSPLQQSLLYRHELDTGDKAYWNQISVRLAGDLDVDAFRSTWQQIIDRHATLRTRFVHDKSGRPLQAVHTSIELPWHFQDLSGFDEQGQQATVLRRSAAATPPLDRPPLFTLALYRVGPSDHLFVWCYHHIILDGWSEALIWNEVWRTYEHIVDRKPLDLVRAAPYAGYIAWLASRDRPQAQAFWQDYLADYTPPALTAVPLPPSDHLDIIEYHAELPADLADRVRQFAAESSLTLSAVLYGAWAMVLSAERGMVDVLFGTVIADRPPELADSDTIAGLMLATVPLRFRTDCRDSVVDWLRRSQSALTDMTAHTALSLADIKAAAGVSADEVLFDAVCAIDSTDTRGSVGKLPASLECLDVRHGGTTEFPLSVVFLTTDRIHVRIHASLPQYDASWPQRAEQRLLQVLRQVCADPNRAVTEIDWLTSEERARLRALDRATTDKAPTRDTIDRRIAARCTGDGGKIAIASEGCDLTYNALEDRVAAIAAGLIGRGVAAQDTVGVFMDRTPDLVASLLAIWRIGAVYVPFDTCHPMERVRKAANDAGLRLTITDADTIDAAAALPQPTDVAELAATADGLDESRADRDSVAYIFYTSGSTGQPNGVPIRHASFANLLTSLARKPGIGTKDRMLAITTVAFDISLVELLLPLSVGATLVLAPADAAANPDRLADALDRHAITVQFATPATWELLIAAGWTGDPKLVALCGGDTLRPDLARNLCSRVQRLWNLYGPTETTVCSTLGPVDADGAIDIGRAIDNTVLRITDAEGRPLPFGVPGELCIGGSGVSPGYLGNEKLTKERFLEATEPLFPGRYFRTGDLATMHEDGTIEHFGRLDYQIKLRGYRIEPGEIEAAINALAGVAGCSVVARLSSDGQKRLVAYIVADAKSSRLLDDATVSRQLAGKLPAYMVPADIVLLPSLPLTSSGKVDRKALPEPVTATDRQVDAELTGTEAEVAALWAELLGHPVASANDNFFRLGGHSLLAARLASRMSRSFAHAPGIGELLDNPTVAAQAALIDRDITQSQTVIAPAANRGRFPLSSVQRRFWFLENIESAAGVNNVCGVYRVSGELDTIRLRRAFERLAERHEILRTVFVVEKGEPWQTVLDTPRVDLQVEHVEDDTALRERITRLADQPFPISEAPPWRARILEHNGETYLLLCFNHMLIDGESLPILLRHLAEFDRDRSEQEPAAPLQYGDFAAWQTDASRRAAHSTALDYWRAKLAGPLPVLQFPSFRARPREQQFAGGSVSFRIDAMRAARLERFAGECGTSLFNVLLAGFTAVLLRYCHQGEVVIGTPVGTIRHAVGAETGIGPYLNTIALRLRPDVEWSLRQLLEHVATTTNEALQHGDLPFEDVVAALPLPRDLSRTPVFQTLFAFAQSEADDWRFGEARCRREPIVQSVARTDLSCWVQGGADGMEIELEYASALFEHDLVRRFAAHLDRYLDSAMTETTREWRRVPLLDQNDLAELLARQGPAKPLPAGRCIGDLVWAAAAKTPQKTAVASRAEQIGYAELERRCKAMADGLRAHGVRPGSLVGLAVSRTERLPLAILAILEAGAAYVPLDTSLPAERVAFVLEDSGAEVVLADDVAAEELAGIGDRVLSLVQLEANGCDERQPAPHNEPDLAYVMYTSGSTGRPKGVAVGHRQVVNMLTGFLDPLCMTSDDVLAAITTTSFDISVLELLLPLIAGATVYVVAEDATGDGKALATELDISGATIMQGTPASWRQLLDAGWAGGPEFRAVCGGEPLPLDLARALRSSCGTLWNAYGPTETTVWSTLAEIREHPETISIGSPIQNTRVYVVDSSDALVPDGVTGEILIAGDGVANGYFGNAELTAQQFCDDPFEADQKLYRTGDLGRWRPDGELEHLGRADSQLKLHGFRIEAGDVESNLTTAAGVQQVAVTKRDGPGGDMRLVAFVVIDPNSSFSAAALRQHLRDRVPRYMIPQHFVRIDKLPLTPNRKVDYARLPPLDLGGARTREAEPPSSRAERLIAEIWCDLIGVSEVSTSDNFFELGGHSMLTVRAIARILEETGAELQPQFFVLEDLATIAQRLEPQLTANDADALARPAAPRGRLGRIARSLFGSRSGTA
jgi:amino acid adenylation domain-containing protein